MHPKQRGVKQRQADPMGGPERTRSRPEGQKGLRAEPPPPASPPLPGRAPPAGGVPGEWGWGRGDPAAPSVRKWPLPQEKGLTGRACPARPLRLPGRPQPAAHTPVTTRGCRVPRDRAACTVGPPVPPGEPAVHSGPRPGWRRGCWRFRVLCSTLSLGQLREPQPSAYADRAARGTGELPTAHRWRGPGRGPGRAAEEDTARFWK